MSEIERLNDLDRERQKYLMLSDLKNAQEAIKKADILIEALPYLRKYTDKYFVIKYGGSNMEEEQMKEQIMKDLIILKYFGIHPILVHGGGKKISSFMKKIGKDPDFVNGLRVTDQETMELTEMALSKVNSELVGLINKLGGKAVGLSGKDGQMILATKKAPVTPISSSGNNHPIDMGFVGDINTISPALLKEISSQGYIPVIAPFAGNVSGESLNINADYVAGELASSIHAEKLVMLTNVPGIMEDTKDSHTFYPTLSVKQVEKMISEQKIHQGMLPKVEACIKANKSGVNRTHIIDGGIKHSLLIEIFTNECIGTMIITGHNEDEEGL